jgi:RNA polymerase sigma-70 factor (ECF subfamily)
MTLLEIRDGTTCFECKYEYSVADDSDRAKGKVMSEEHPEPASDDDLVGKVRAGDIEAFEVLYHRHKGVVFARILSIVGDHNEARELLQETFVTAHGKLVSFDGSGSLGGWLRRIALNCTFMMFRARKKMRVTDPATVADLMLTLPDNAGKDVTTPVDSMLRRELESCVAKAISDLPQPLRDTFCLAALERKSYAETAQVLGISVSLVKVQVFRARERLKVALAQYLHERGEDMKT